MDSLSDYQPKSVDGRVIVPAILAIFDEFHTKFDSFRSTFETMLSDMQNKFVKVCEERDVKIERMDKQIISMKKQISVLESKIDDNDQHERRDTVIISGKAVPPAKRDENCSEVTCKLVKDQLNVILSPMDISVSHRLGEKKNTQGPDHRDIIVKFCRRNTKMELLAAARTIKSPNLYVNESLTPLRQTIAFVLRKAGREFPDIISGSTTLDGRNYVWVKPANPTAPGAKSLRLTISNHDRLLELCNKTLGKPLTHFLSEWTH